MEDSGMKRRFTLIEVLTVIVIMSVLMAIMAAGYRHFGEEEKTRSGARALSRALLLARSEAIASRRRVAVLLPERNAPIRLHGTYAWCHVSKQGKCEGLVPRTKIEWFPPGAEVIKIGLAPGVTEGNPFQTVSLDWSMLGEASGNGTCRAVIYRQNGAIVDEVARRLTIARVDQTGKQIPNTSSYVIEVQGYTGSSSFVREK